MNLNITQLKEYPNISSMLKQYTYSDILNYASQALNISPSELEKSPMGGYSKGKLSGAYSYVLKDLIKNVRHYDWLYAHLADEESKNVFTRLIQFRLFPLIEFIQKAFDPVNHQYFDKNIIHCDENEVFVDCGGFIGDTSEDYIRQYGKYKRIYVYEPSDDNIDKCRDNLSKYENVIVRNCGVGERSSELAINSSRSSSSFVGVSEGDSIVKIVSLDEDITEPVTYIKMDIEGFEIPALIGAKNHIKNDSPKLAICVYHIISDIWEIPKLINSINQGYKFYIRQYCDTQNWESVIYAVPVGSEKQKSEKTHSGKRNVVSVHYGEGWTNVQLAKDCGLVPFLLYKNHGCSSRMVSRNKDNYTYLDTIVKGMKMDLLPTGSEEEKYEYIVKNAADIDLLCLFGPYDTYANIAPVYKSLNPNGKIYIALDANSGWMDRIQWDSVTTSSILDSCDVIATSCTAMQKHLNEKWRWKIYSIPNGYYNTSGIDEKPDFDKKENIILTVGRIGTEQKATEILLQAFALVSDKIPSWDLRLVGNIREEFDTYIEDFLADNPELIDRITFTGAISDKAKLRREFLNAKIFAMPSRWEGGSPNVISEALTAGCVTAVTKFDAYTDAINSGKCGMASEIDDVKGFADVLLSLAQNEKLKDMSEEAVRHGEEFYNMEKIVARLNELVFGGN